MKNIIPKEERCTSDLSACGQGAIERFRSVNAMYGQAYGDEVQRLIGRELLAFADENEGIGGHSIGDHFNELCASRLKPTVLNKARKLRCGRTTYSFRFT